MVSFILMKIVNNIIVFLTVRSTTTGVWLGMAGLAFCYITDWKVVMAKIPYVKGKFPPEPSK